MLCLFICLACLFCHWPSSSTVAVHRICSNPPLSLCLDIVATLGKFQKKMETTMQTSQTAAGKSQLAMVAQLGQDPTLQPAAVPSNNEKPDSKRGRNSAPPRGSSAPPRGVKRPQSVGSQDSGSSRQARVPPWPMRKEFFNLLTCLSLVQPGARDTRSADQFCACP